MTATSVYRAYAEDGSLLYVGCSQNVKARLAQHRSTSQWHACMARLDVVEFPSREEALAAEAQAIREEAPAHNVVGRPSAGMTPEQREAIRAEVATWPPLTEAQRETIRRALRQRQSAQEAS